jgi:hypothetical protein
MTWLRAFPLLVALLAAHAGWLASTPAATAQSPAVAPGDTAGAFLDPVAAELLSRARSARLATDSSLLSYTAIVRSRVAGGLRMPLKDRTLFRQESAVRARWSRDAETVVQLLAGRGQSPGGVSPVTGLSFGVSNLFDPTEDRLSFGMPMMSDSTERGDDFWIEHPLGRLAERHYRYASGDLVTIRLQEGREIRVRELHLIPRRSDPRTVRGILWVDEDAGAVVQGAFRLARTVDIIHDLNAVDDEDMAAVQRIPLITPMEFDISLLTVEYALWDMRHWLPRTFRMEGMARVGVMRFSVAADVSYGMLEVVTDSGLAALAEADAVQRVIAEWAAEGDYEIRDMAAGRRRAAFAVLTPSDEASLLESDLLPPPIWADAPGFATRAELRDLEHRVTAMAAPLHPHRPTRFTWGLDELDLIRYNRVEALSMGARVTAPLPAATVVATARLGAADLHPNGELLVRREGPHRTLELRGYHELDTAHQEGGSGGLATVVPALLLGRDDGEYFRATGAAVTLAPPSMARRGWEVTGYAEAHGAVRRRTHLALPRLWTDSVFRSNIEADQAFQVGAMARVRPWWGTDPHGVQTGLDVLLQGETGDFPHARGQVTLRAALPLGSGLRVGAEAGAGSSHGDVPLQRHFFLGGVSTLRGYPASVASGTSMARGRLELRRTRPAANLVLFSDWGWAGDRAAVQSVDQRWSVGAGASLLDGVLRFDLSHALRPPRGWRLDLYLDALL